VPKKESTRNYKLQNKIYHYIIEFSSFVVKYLNKIKNQLHTTVSEKYFAAKKFAKARYLSISIDQIQGALS